MKLLILCTVFLAKKKCNHCAFYSFTSQSLFLPITNSKAMTAMIPATVLDCKSLMKCTATPDPCNLLN